MKRALLFALAAAAASCGTPDDRYKANDLMLATSYAAKESCSCLFVMGQTEEYCRAWTVASPQVAAFTVDYKAKTVESRALMMWAAKARFVDEHVGCLLE